MSSARCTLRAGAQFGGVVTDAAPAYAANDTARAIFLSACPRNDVRRGGTFLAVERLDEADGAWRTVRGFLPSGGVFYP